MKSHEMAGEPHSEDVNPVNLPPHVHNKMDFSAALASSVHDMKNSLGMLLNTVSEMVGKIPPQTPEHRQFYSVLEYESARINNELIQLLSLYRMDEKRLLFVVEENFVLDTLEDQFARNEMLFTSRGIDVVIDCDPGLVWYYDSEMISGVLNNLFINCARYSRNCVSISARLERGYLVIRVEDDGEGYPNAMLRDAAAPMGVSFSSGSTRLGLVFARRVLHMHKVRDKNGFLKLTNSGSLSGGVAELYLP